MEDGMNKFACRYAVLQFVPYMETGEFANVGVVLVCPQTGYFGFQLQTRKHKRITDFFDELPKQVYQRSVQIMLGELKRTAEQAEKVAQAAIADRAEYLRLLFDALIHPRETLMRFSQSRVVMADDPEAEVLKQFDHYVDRAFVTPEYVEQGIERRVKALLERLELPRPFKADRVGDDEVYARFPLVQKRGGEVAKIIKPFNLSQSETMGIYDHGAVWLDKVRRLRDRNLLPADVMFAVAGPPATDTKRFAAFLEICRSLEAQDVLPVDAEKTSQIAEFALGG
jgi:hypothetical protein